MKLLNKIKSIFFSEEKKEEIKIEQEPQKEEPKEELDIQPKGEIIGTCLLCQKPYGTEDRLKDFNNNKVHKRCAKKAVKAMYQGQNVEELFKNMREDGIR